MKEVNIPKEVLICSNTLSENNYDAYLVGGCVRDLILNKIPKDWDITTNANPTQIEKKKKKSFINNKYGTVTIITQSNDETLQEIEITPYRVEGGYTDGRHPDEVKFVNDLEDDLSRRDFTVNAIALNPKDFDITDPFGGINDIAKGIVRTVNDPSERFEEDYLRMMRAVRIATVLEFDLDKDALEAIKKNASKIKKISAERVRDELIKIIESKNAVAGFKLLRSSGLLKQILPELQSAVGIEQSGCHKFDVFTHLIKSMECAIDKEMSLELRLAALLHDIGKPPTRYWSKKKGIWTFHNHEVVGAHTSKEILTRLRMNTQLVEKVKLLIRWHMFFSDTEQITLSAVRRMIARVGEENIQDLLTLRVCDRVGTGRPKENPYRLRKYRALVEEVLRENITPGKLDIDGKEIMACTNEAPGPRVGHIQHILLSETLEDEKKNTKSYLQTRAKELSLVDDKKLKEMGEKGKLRTYEEEEGQIKDIRKSFGVQ